MFLLAAELPSLITFFGLLLVAASVLYQTRKRINRQRRAKAQAPAVMHHSKSSSARGNTREADRELVEMYDLAREVTAQIDSKMSGLRQLIRMANEESQRLESAIDEAQRRGILDQPPSTPAWAAAAEMPLPFDSAAPAESAQAAESARDAEAPAQSETPRRRIPETSPGQTPTESVVQRRAAIVALAEAGLDPTAISQRVQRSLSEVELILSMRNQELA